MRLLALFCTTVLMTSGASRACAQAEASPTPRPTPPAPPLLNGTPDSAAWKIVRYVIPKLGEQSAEAVVRSVATAPKPESLTSVSKTGQVRHQERKLKTGEQEDIWYEHGNRIIMESVWKIPMFEGNTSGVKLPLGPDFPELAWISASNFVGTQEDQGATYFVFETQVTEGDANKAQAYGYKLQAKFNRAYINADTRLPWLHQTGDILERYFFQAAPKSTLDVPPEYQKMFDTFERKKAESVRRPIAP